MNAPTTGPDLREEREALGVKIIAVAAAMGVSRNTITRLESRPAVSPGKARRYLRALAEAQS